MTYRPIPGWKASTPPVFGPTVESVLTDHHAVAIHFWATWNGVDPPTENALVEIAKELAGRLHLASCDIDDPENVEFCQRCGVANIPTVIIFIGGKLRKLIVGFNGPDQLKAQIKAAIS
jgi:thioredoxin 1